MFDRFFLRSFLYLTPLAVALLTGGCGSKVDEASLVLAEVGDRQVTAEYFIERLSRLTEANFPRGEDGQVLDMSKLEGKRAFLNVIVDKELMVAKALQLGYLEEPRIAGARASLSESFGMKVFWQDNADDPSQEISQAQIDHYSSRLGETRRYRYLIASTEAEALEARQALLDGTPWSEAVARFHQSPTTEDRVLEAIIMWGQARESYQRPIFAAEINEFTEPIETSYGWWIVQVIGIEISKKQVMDVNQIRSSIAMHKSQFLREQVIMEIKQQRNYRLDEQALRIIMDGLPEGEVLLDPKTGQPVPREQLKPLQIPTTEYDRVLASYDLSSGPETMTLVDYKTFYDRQNVFERPKKSEGLVALQNKLENQLVRIIVIDEARRRGYMEDPRVQKQAFALLEEMLVDRVNDELVTVDEEVSMAEIRSFYEEHEDAFWQPERREGSLISFDTQNQAQEARQAWMNDALGEEVDLVSVGPMIENPTRPLNKAIFELALDDISEPYEMANRWGVVRLDNILAPQMMELEPVREHIAQRIKARRHEQELRRLLDKWREEFGVTVYEDNLKKMPAWEEAVVASGRPLPE